MLVTYLSYLKSVLGIENLPVSADSSTLRPLFLLEKSPNLQSVLTAGPARELFEKMLAALGFKISEIEIKEVELTSEKLALAHVILTSVAAENNWPELKSPAVKSYHPAELIAQPALKRVAWDYLQKARRN